MLDDASQKGSGAGAAKVTNSSGSWVSGFALVLERVTRELFPANFRGCACAHLREFHFEIDIKIFTD